MGLIHKPTYSVIIPVYNRPDEVDELLTSLTKQIVIDFEVVIVEDGSVDTCAHIVKKHEQLLHIGYYVKKNEGPGPTRNFGAKKASGRWLIFLDSDCFLPESYFQSIDHYLSENNIDAFGGPDMDHQSFTPIQKSISFAMTSFLTTGGIRGSKKSIEKFKPRSFNMGIKKTVFEDVGGFSKLRFGEDIDLSIKLFEAGFKTELIESAYVYHKRRANFRQFHKQIFNSGIARIILHDIHPGSLNLIHLFPAFFVFGNITLLIWCIREPGFFLLIIAYPFLLFSLALIKFKSMKVSLLSIVAAYVQLGSYGFGFLKAYWIRKVLKKPMRYAYLDSFYD